MTAFIRRYFAGGASATTLASSMSNSDTSFVINSSSGWPGSPGNPFYVVIDRGNTSEEKILCASNAGTTVTVTARGQDGTSATTHAANAPVEVCITGVDGDEANQAVNLLGNATEGSIFYGRGAGAMPAKLVIGTAGQVLGSNGTDPAWQNPGGYSGSTPGAPTSGTYAIGAIYMDSVGVMYVCAVAGTPGTWKCAPGQLLGRTQYNPAGALSYTTTSSTIVAVDNANLAVTFAAPPSGAVVFSWECFAQPATSGGTIVGGIYDVNAAGPLASDPIALLAYNGNTANVGWRVKYSALVTGLTAGTSYKWAPGYSTPGAVTATLGVGAASPYYGTFLVEARSA